MSGLGLRDPLFDQAGVVVAADYSDAATFYMPGAIEKLDLTVASASGDVVMQLRPVGRDDWVPAAGITLRSGLFRSIPKPGGSVAVTAVRFKCPSVVGGGTGQIDFTAFLTP